MAITINIKATSHLAPSNDHHQPPHKLIELKVLVMLYSPLSLQAAHGSADGLATGSSCFSTILAAVSSD